jgi:hypothetical protein
MNRVTGIAAALLAALPAAAQEANAPAGDPALATRDDRNLDVAIEEIQRGRRIFRDDTFGNQVFWGGQLRLHKAIAGAANGGTGPGLSPKAALELGLKVDLEALPEALRQALRRGDVDLDDPATTLALLKLDAVVGVRGFLRSGGRAPADGWHHLRALSFHRRQRVRARHRPPPGRLGRPRPERRCHHRFLPERAAVRGPAEPGGSLGECRNGPQGAA